MRHLLGGAVLCLGVLACPSRPPRVPPPAPVVLLSIHNTTAATAYISLEPCGDESCAVAVGAVPAMADTTLDVPPTLMHGRSVRVLAHVHNLGDVQLPSIEPTLDTQVDVTIVPLLPLSAAGLAPMR